MKHETGERNKYIEAKGTIKHQRFTKDRKCYAEHSNTRPSILATSRASEKSRASRASEKSEGGESSKNRVINKS